MSSRETARLESVRTAVTAESWTSSSHGRESLAAGSASSILLFVSRLAQSRTVDSGIESCRTVSLVSMAVSWCFRFRERCGREEPALQESSQLLVTSALTAYFTAVKDDRSIRGILNQIALDQPQGSISKGMMTTALPNSASMHINLLKDGITFYKKANSQKRSFEEAFPTGDGQESQPQHRSADDDSPPKPPSASTSTHRLKNSSGPYNGFSDAMVRYQNDTTNLNGVQGSLDCVYGEAPNGSNTPWMCGLSDAMVRCPRGF